MSFHPSVIGRARARARIRWPHQPRLHRFIPSNAHLDALMITCSRSVPHQSGANSEGRERRISKRFAAELRRRGWLAAEGYAPGSWAAP